MSNLVRFFIDGDEQTHFQFENATIPQLDSTVFLADEMYFVNDITYSYDAEEEEDFNLIDVCVSKKNIDF